MNLIVFCGYPQSGKDHAARFLTKLGYKHYDDKKILRDMTKIAFFLDDWHVSTQEGKSSIMPDLGKNVMVRQAMADLGRHFEEQYGHDFFARRALADISRLPSNNEHYVISSARMDQPRIYRDAGAFVIELVRRGCEPIVHEDWYDKGAAHLTLTNPGTDDAFEEILYTALKNWGIFTGEVS